MTTTRIMGALAIAGILAAAGAVAQETPPTGEPEGPAVATIARNCLGCHGPDAVSPGAMPTLAGKTVDYLTLRLKELRDGTRPSTIMGRIMKPFADEDIADIAAYFAVEKVEVSR